MPLLFAAATRTSLVSKGLLLEESITLRVWLEHLGLELPPASTLTERPTDSTILVRLIARVCTAGGNLHRLDLPDMNQIGLLEQQEELRRLSQQIHFLNGKARGAAKRRRCISTYCAERLLRDLELVRWNLEGRTDLAPSRRLKGEESFCASSLRIWQLWNKPPRRLSTSSSDPGTGRRKIYFSDFKFGIDPWSLSGGVSTSGFWQSISTLRGPGSEAPICPRIGSGIWRELMVALVTSETFPRLSRGCRQWW
jgi:hypothetical protein